MPIYEYACGNCDLKKSFQHSYDERIEVCPACGEVKEFKKVLSSFKTKAQPKSSSRIGDLTKEYIEENRKILEDHKKELRKDKV